jgi:hypothetical protein
MSLMGAIETSVAKTLTGTGICITDTSAIVARMVAVAAFQCQFPNLKVGIVLARL